MIWIYMLGLVLFAVLLLGIHQFVPNFQREAQYTRAAENVTRSDLERARLKKGKATLWLSEKILPKITQNPILNIDRLLGKNMKQIIEVMGKYASVEEMLAIKLLQALILSSPIFLLCFLLDSYYAAVPVSVVIFLIKGIRDVKASFASMQREITKDLPKFIDKMNMALESGKSFVTVFREMEKRCGIKMKLLLKRLNSNLQHMDPGLAIEIFARETTIPIMLPFATAIKIGINSGYEEGKVHLDEIREEILKLRRTAMEENTKSKPERVKLSTIGIIFMAIGSVIICFVSIFSDLLHTF
ncbi:hypothetical protein [Paenibacillus polymyxa]|uniref:hypothetical protein n=1 Tax=Paenibacillus polymyxa TaxID=1406 RepID=UPI0023F9A413|nr:hypothetical protein [Paenibacillus polymyxa]